VATGIGRYKFNKSYLTQLQLFLLCPTNCSLLHLTILSIIEVLSKSWGNVPQITYALTIKLSLYMLWNCIDGVVVLLQSFLTSALDWGETSSSPPGRFTPGGRAPDAPSNRNFGRSQNWFGFFVEKRESSCFCRDSKLGPCRLLTDHSTDWTVLAHDASEIENEFLVFKIFIFRTSTCN
jgi:hypothetical protein